MTSEDYRPDREINVRVLIRLTLVLLALVAVAFVAMWRLTIFLQAKEVAADPPPPALLEARAPHLPPSPRLQADPPADMASYLAAAESRLNSYGWSDEGRGMAHIPIVRAMEVMIEDGLPETLAAAQPQPVESEN